MLAIKLIFIGMLLVFLSLDIPVGAFIVGLFPSFLGYFFMYKGLLDISNYSCCFKKMIVFTRGMIFYSGFLYGINLLGISTLLPLLFSALEFIAIGFSLYISFNIIAGIRDIETALEENLNFYQLYFAWKLFAVFSVLPFVTGFVPLLAVTSMMIGFAVGIYYLYSFYNTMELFYGSLTNE